MTSTGDSTRADGGGNRRPLPADEAAVVRHDEDVAVGAEWEEVERLGVRRVVDREHVSDDYPREHDELAYERVPAGENDSGQIEMLPDGSISIPLFEEELEVVTRTVLRERVIVRKERVTEWQRVEAERRRERIELELREAGATKPPPETQV